MTIIETADASLRVDDHGSGPAVLALAPGGMRSAADWWDRAPWNPVELSCTHHVIAMDQRNAGGSRRPCRRALEGARRPARRA